MAPVGLGVAVHVAAPEVAIKRVHTLEDVDYCGGGIDNCVYLVRKPEEEELNDGEEESEAAVDVSSAI